MECLGEYLIFTLQGWNDFIDEPVDLAIQISVGEGSHAWYSETSYPNWGDEFDGTKLEPYLVVSK